MSVSKNQHDKYLEGLEKDKEFKKHLKNMEIERLRKQGIDVIDQSELTPEERRQELLKSTEKPGTMSNSSATFFWLVAMLISLLFKGSWALCILETIIWWKHITR